VASVMSALNIDALLGRPSPEHVEDPASAPAPGGSPPAHQLGLELLAAWQLVRLLRAAPWLVRAPRGSGDVVDMPGWRAPEASNAPVRGYLRMLGYDARPWGLGTNRGTPVRDVERLVQTLPREHDGPVALVGWSLGGLIAREVARVIPEKVSCVVTYGTPVVGGPAHTFAARFYGEQVATRAHKLGARLDSERPIEVPVTAIYSRADGIVDWRACIDRRSPRVRHVEVRSTHLGLGVDPDVWWVLAETLAAHQHSGA